MRAGEWILAGVVLCGEVVGLVDRGDTLGWLGLSVAAAGLAVGVPLSLRVEKTSGESPVSGFVGLVMFALPVLVILSLSVPTGVRVALFVTYGVLLTGWTIYLERTGKG
ncbi:hypothetical protein ACSNOI_09895 [Actinomadura kijaniata]|uniref:hypothetical protein n=1 Tax=Actinomadura kijaniata TaxID=46161 RepID=UPI003F1C0067